MNDETWKGVVHGATGHEYNVEVEHVRPGVAPAYIWLAMEHDEIPKGRAIVALVGAIVDAAVLAKQCRLTGISRLDHMVVVLGTWPRERMEEIVRALNTDGTGPKQWARRSRRDRDRKDWMPSSALVDELVAIYTDQVRRFGPQESR